MSCPLRPHRLVIVLYINIASYLPHTELFNIHISPQILRILHE